MRRSIIVLAALLTSCGVDPCEGHFEEIYYPARVVYLPDADDQLTPLYTEDSYQEEWVCDEE